MKVRDLINSLVGMPADAEIVIGANLEGFGLERGKPGGPKLPFILRPRRVVEGKGADLSGCEEDLEPLIWIEVEE